MGKTQWILQKLLTQAQWQDSSHEVFSQRDLSQLLFFCKVQEFPWSSVNYFYGSFVCWGFIFFLSSSGAQALVKLLGLTQTLPEEGQPAPALAGELWQGKPHIKRNSVIISKTSGENLFSVKDQVAVNIKYFFPLEISWPWQAPPRILWALEVSCCPLRCLPDYTWVWASLSKYNVGLWERGRCNLLL